MTTYWEKLKDPRWQKLRLEVMERDGWACQYCMSPDKPLHVHHGYYEGKREPWEYDAGTLHTACEDCHDLANDLRRDIQFEAAKVPLRAQDELMHMIISFRKKVEAELAKAAELEEETG